MSPTLRYDAEGPPEVRRRHPSRVPHLGGTALITEIDPCDCARVPHKYMRRLMIIDIDPEAEPILPMNRRHHPIITQRLGYASPVSICVYFGDQTLTTMAPAGRRLQERAAECHRVLRIILTGEASIVCLVPERSE
jgi:hypothetical protein